MGCGSSKKEPAKPAAGAAGAKPAGKSPSDGGGGGAKPAPTKPGEPRNVMNKYKMFMTKDDIMGEGTSSICRKGQITASGKDIAIKIYKDTKGGAAAKEVTLQKYRRQISVLNELQEPFKQPTDAALWHEQLANVKPSRIFMELLDYSKTPDGTPNPDPDDGVLYVVSELAQYSLKDFLAQRRDQAKPLSKDSVKNISKAIVVAMAGLHAKAFVHVDMKPENMMMFSGRLKIIDVDGCVRAGTNVSIQDSSISFSPCYCAPEWARFLIKDSESTILASPALDVWSVGMTLCELVTLDAILKPQYANFLRNAQSHREAGFLFMEWLSSMQKPPLPKAIVKFDQGLLELLSKWLLVCNKTTRKTCAQCLSNPYIAEGGWQNEGDKEAIPEATAVRIQRDRASDESLLAPIYKGVLWKMNTKGVKTDAASFIKRDMWIAHNHSLCYYSVKENKRLVLIDGAKLTTATIEKISGAAREHCFSVSTPSDSDDGAKMDVAVFAAESADELTEWLDKLKKSKNMDMIVTMHLGKGMAEELEAFKMTIKNRRIKIDQNDEEAHQPVFKAKLWKVKAEGDRTKPEDWFEREMWVGKNGSLVYWSKKEDRDLVYYTSTDIQRATINEIKDGDAHHNNAFQIQLSPADGVEFSPGEFAAESPEMKATWISEFKKLM